MWNNFCAVVIDLFWFALGVQSKNEIVVYGHTTNQGLFSQYRLAGEMPLQARIAPPLAPVFLASPARATLLPKNTLQTATAHSTFAGNAVPEVSNPSPAILHAPIVMYVSEPAGTACVHAPQIDFDVMIETLPYGTAVTVIGYQGRFASVNRSNITGWVAKDALTPQKHDVWPQYMSGTTYDVAHAETVKTRRIVTDVFGAGSLGLPLQAGEYIMARLKSEHRTIAWSRKRPRIAGAWANLLKGTLGIHSGITPKTDSIMEWQGDDGEGRLGYIESVMPDLTITVSAVGVDEAGRYSVKTMSEEIWRELRPVFIEVA